MVVVVVVVVSVEDSDVDDGNVGDVRNADDEVVDNVEVNEVLRLVLEASARFIKKEFKLAPKYLISAYFFDHI